MMPATLALAAAKVRDLDDAALFHAETLAALGAAERTLNGHAVAQGTLLLWLDNTGRRPTLDQLTPAVTAQCQAETWMPPQAFAAHMVEWATFLTEAGVLAANPFGSPRLAAGSDQPVGACRYVVPRVHRSPRQRPGAPPLPENTQRLREARVVLHLSNQDFARWLGEQILQPGWVTVRRYRGWASGERLVPPVVLNAITPVLEGRS
jgi:hypothetical protein